MNHGGHILPDCFMRRKQIQHLIKHYDFGPSRLCQAFTWVIKLRTVRAFFVSSGSPSVGEDSLSLSSLSSSSSLESSSSQSGVAATESVSWTSNAGSNWWTAEFAVFPSEQALVVNSSLQILHTLVSGRLHLMWNECPHPWKTRHNVLWRLQWMLSHALF